MSTVTVTDPRNDNSGGRVSTTYAVNTKTSSVRRKYSDFQWLRGRLSVETPGAIVPIVPHKYALDKKFEPDFIEERRHQLQRFLQNVMDHPELALSGNDNDMSALRVFLTIPLGDDFDNAKKLSETNATTAAIATAASDDDNGAPVAQAVAVDASTPSAAQSAKKSISGFFSKAMTLTQVTAGSVELVETEGEEQITAISSYVNQVEGHVGKLLKGAQNLIKLTQDQSTQFDEIGIPIGGWRTTYQNNTSTKDDDPKTMESMSAIVQFSTDYAELLQHKHDAEQSQFFEAMEGLSLELKAFQAALNQRYDFRVRYTAKFQKLKDREAALTKQRGRNPSTVTKQIEKAQIERDEMQRKADLSKRRLEDCTQRILREADRTKLHFENSLKDCIKAYAKLQMDYNQKMTDAWTKLLPQLD